MRNSLIRVFVNQTKMFEVSKFSSIFSLKRQIIKTMYNSDDIENIILMNESKILQDDYTVNNYNIKNNSNITIHYKINGGDAINIDIYKKFITLIYIFVILPLSLIFFIIGIPSIISSIIVGYFKKNASPLKSFFIKLTQVILLFWFIVIFLTLIVLIPYYFISKSSCYMFKNASDLAWTGGMIYIVFFILYYLLDILDLSSFFKIIIPTKVLNWIPLDKVVDQTKCWFDMVKVIPPKLLLYNYGTYTNMLYDPVYKAYDIAPLITLSHCDDNKKITNEFKEIIKRLGTDQPTKITVGGTDTKEKKYEMSDLVSLCKEFYPKTFSDALNSSNTFNKILSDLPQLAKDSISSRLNKVIEIINMSPDNRKKLDPLRIKDYDNFKNLCYIIKIIKEPIGLIYNNIPANEMYKYLELGPVLAAPVLLFIPIKICFDIYKKFAS